MKLKHIALLVLMGLFIAGTLHAGNTRTISGLLVGIGVRSGSPDSTWLGAISTTDSILTSASAWPYAPADSTASPSIYCYRAKRVLINYSLRNGSSLAHVPILEVSMDDFATLSSNPSGSGENVMINGELATGTSTRRPMIIYAMNNTSTGETDVIPWKYARLRFGPCTAVDTLNASYSVTWEDDKDQNTEERVHLIAASGALTATCSLMNTYYLKPGMQVWEAGGNTALADRTFVATISGTTVTLTKKTTAALTSSSVVYAGW